MNRYLELKQKHQDEVNKFPMAFAFNKRQFEEGMKKLGLEPTDTDKVYRLGGTGGFYKKTDAEALHGMFKRHSTEMQQAIDSDETGEGFIFEMFDYELGNHEYTYTNTIEDAINALGLTPDDIRSNERLQNGLRKAKKAQWDWFEING